MLLVGTALAVDSTTSGKAVPNRTQLLQQKLETKKENAENKIMAVKEKIASKEAALKTRLQQFKNKKKAEIAERVNTNLNKINQNQTDQMKKHLDKMSAILDKLEARTAVDPARAVIASASAAVTAQAQNDYTIQVTTETKVRTDAQMQRTKLHSDLSSVRKAVIDAKQAVANAIRTVKKEAAEDGQ